MIRLPFGLALVVQREWDAVVDHASHLLAERCRLTVEHDTDEVIVSAQTRIIRSQDREISELRAAVADKLGADVERWLQRGDRE